MFEKNFKLHKINDKLKRILKLEKLDPLSQIQEKKETGDVSKDPLIQIEEFPREDKETHLYFEEYNPIAKEKESSIVKDKLVVAKKVYKKMDIEHHKVLQEDGHTLQVDINDYSHKF